MTAGRSDPTLHPDGELTGAVIGAFFHVYNVLGHGFVESVYERALVAELNARGLRATRQVPLQVWYGATAVGSFRADVVVEGRLVLELKAAARIDAAHRGQLMNYLKASRLPLGLLLNFGPVPEFARLIGRRGGAAKEPTRCYHTSAVSAISVVLLPPG